MPDRGDEGGSGALRSSTAEPSTDEGRVWDLVALGLGTFITLAGIMHFVSPGFFDAIVPPWLGPSERFWTYASGVAELVVGPMVLLPRTRIWGARAAIVLFLAVYPANIYMVWDWRDRSAAEQVVSWVRLPFQFVFIWIAWKVSRRHGPSARG